MRDGMYWSGDLGYADSRGFCWFSGRAGGWLRVDGGTSVPLEWSGSVAPPGTPTFKVLTACAGRPVEHSRPGVVASPGAPRAYVLLDAEQAAALDGEISAHLGR